MPDYPVTLTAIKSVLAKHKLAPLKSLGQNFLFDHNTLEKIVNAGSVSDDDLVLEIGPGLGALTWRLAEKARQVVAVEYDRGLFGILQDLFADKLNVALINADFLQVDLDHLFQPRNESAQRFKVVANLPYYITTPLIFKLVESGVRWETMVFLVQKEVADRICAKPGGKEYGTLSVMLNYYGYAEQIGTVSKNVFYPAPQVNSAIVRITPDWERFDPEVYACLQRVVQAAFGQRRKTLLNAFGVLIEDFGGKEALAGFLESSGIDPKRRGETLSVNEFLTVAEGLRSRKQRDMR